MMDRPYHPIAIEVVQLYLDRHSSSVGAHEFAQKLAGLVDNPVQSLQAENAALREVVTMLANFDARNSIVHLRKIARALIGKEQS